MTVVEYAVKFESLARYYPYHHGEIGERSKCIKFLNGLRLEIKMAMNYQGINNFIQLTNMCRVYDEDNEQKRPSTRVSAPVLERRGRS